MSGNDFQPEDGSPMQPRPEGTSMARESATQISSLQELLHEHQKSGAGMVSRLDVINAGAQIHLRKALNLCYLPLVESWHVERNERIAGYRFGSIFISRQWRDLSYEYFWWDIEDGSPGWWQDSATGRTGKDSVSLLEYLRSLEYLRACSTQDDLHSAQEAARRFQSDSQHGSVIFDLSARLGIDLANPILPLPPSGRRWCPVEAASRSSPPFDQSSWDAEGPWPEIDVMRIPFLGRPHRQFEIKDKRGQLQQIIGSYDTAWGRPLQVPFSLWHREVDPLEQRWKMRRSGHRHFPFGVENLIQHPQSPVLIVDNLALASDLQSHIAGHVLAITAWPRALPGEHPRDTIWSILAGRRVSIVLAPIDRTGCEAAIALCDELRDIGIASLSIRLLEESADVELLVKCRGKISLLGEEMSPERLMEFASSRFGLQTGVSTSPSLEIWRFGDACDASSDVDFVIKPIMPVGSVTVLYSEPGAGKTWLAALMAYSVACGTDVVDRWHVPRRRNVLFISSEMTAAIATRFQKIDESIGGKPSRECLRLYPNPKLKVGKIDLQNSATWEEISHLVHQADFLIIDHLTNVTDGSNNFTAWKKLWENLDGLKRDGKTILLLHHTGKDGQQRGTSQLSADIDLEIRMDRDPEFANAALISYGKNRDDLGFGRALRPFRQFWNQDDDSGRGRWWTEPADECESQKEKWKSPPPPSALRITLNETMIQSLYQGRRRALIQILAENAAGGGEGIGISALASQLHVSHSTVQAQLKLLLKDEVVVHHGNGKARTYRLGAEASERYLIRPV